MQRGQNYGDWGYRHRSWLPKGADEESTAIGIFRANDLYPSKTTLVIGKTGADTDFHDHEMEAIALFQAIGASLQTN